MKSCFIKKLIYRSIHLKLRQSTRITKIMIIMLTMPTQLSIHPLTQTCNTKITKTFITICSSHTATLSTIFRPNLFYTIKISEAMSILLTLLQQKLLIMQELAVLMILMVTILMKSTIYGTKAILVDCNKTNSYSNCHHSINNSTSTTKLCSWKILTPL